MSEPLEKAVIKILIDGINAAPYCKAIKIHGSGFQEAGTPDVIACIHGGMYLIEAKRTRKDNPTPIQQKRLDEWYDAGAAIFVIRGVDEAKRFISEYVSPG